MTLVGFHYTKISAEKKKAITGKVNASNNLVLDKVQEAKLSGSASQKGIEFTFKFMVVFEPGIGTVELQGKVVYMGTPAKVKESLDKWTKDKNLSPEILEEVYNSLLHRCNIEALLLSKEMQMPSHLPMPKVKQKK